MAAPSNGSQPAWSLAGEATGEGRGATGMSKRRRSPPRSTRRALVCPERGSTELRLPE